MRLLLSTVLLSACAGTKDILIESVQPARIVDARTGEVLCKRTPCRIEAERLWPLDSSLHYKLLRAISDSGVTRELAVDTHEVRDGQTIRFDFPRQER